MDPHEAELNITTLKYGLTVGSLNSVDYRCGSKVVSIYSRNNSQYELTSGLMFVSEPYSIRGFRRPPDIISSK